MKELSLHILDISENSVRAGAHLIEIVIEEDARKDLFSIVVRDDGCGMDRDTLQKSIDPFYTTKTVRRIGMGLSLFKSAAIRAGGDMKVSSTPGSGTEVTCWFVRSHVDRQPLGDMAMTILNILLARDDLRVVFRHRIDNEEFIFDSDIVKSALDGVPISEPEVMKFITEVIRERKNLAD